MRWSVLVLAMMVGCAGDSPDDTDTDTDTDTDIDTDTDTDSDTSAPFVPDASCEYLDLWQYVVACDAVWTQMLQWVDPDGASECPSYYALDGHLHLDAGSSIASAGCDASCVYRPGTAVMFLSCGYRSEYISYVPGGPGQTGPDVACPEILYFQAYAGSGWYSSMDAFEAENPCPER